MRNSATIFQLTRFTASEMERPTTTFSPPPSAIIARSSPWHSPIPYLFGGLAAMLGLIAFALLILACSYWKLSGQADGGSADGDVEGGRTAAKGDGGPDDEASPVFEEKLLVIMAGELKPTFLATPTSNSRNPSFNDEKNMIISSGKKENKEENEDQNDHSDHESH